MNNVPFHTRWERVTDDFGRPSLFVPVLFGEDYDRCFGNTNEAMRVTLNTLEDIADISPEAVRQEQVHVEAAGKPFNTVETIVRMLEEANSGITWQHDIKPAIQSRAERQHHQERLLTLGSQAAIGSAIEQGMYPLVITYGAMEDSTNARQRWTAREWQSTKVGMTPVLRDHPLVVSELRSKGKLFESWRTTLHGNDAFILPTHAWIEPEVPTYVKEILLVDDKVVTYEDFSDGMYGIHYLPELEEEVRLAQVTGEYPEDGRVVLARGMGQVAMHIEAMGTRLPSEYFHNIA